MSSVAVPAVRAFICGCGHSGNSLVAALLAAHPEAYVPLDETGIFTRSPTTARRLYGKLLVEAGRTGKRALIEKTPKHVQNLELIRRLEPAARFVMPVRDGRDVAASIGRRSGDSRLGVERWIRDNTLVWSERTSPDVFVFRYEDLVEDPPGTLAEICRFLEIEFTPELLEYHRTPRLWFRETAIRRGDGRDGAEHRALRNWQVNQPLFDGRGRWQAELAPEHVAELTEGSGRELMQAFGYL